MAFLKSREKFPNKATLPCCLKADVYPTLEVMHLTDEQIIQFQTLYKKHFGADISKEQAHEEGLKLVGLIQLIDKPMTKELLRELTDDLMDQISNLVDHTQNFIPYTVPVSEEAYSQLRDYESRQAFGVGKTA